MKRGDKLYCHKNLRAGIFYEKGENYIIQHVDSLDNSMFISLEKWEGSWFYIKEREGYLKWKDYFYTLTEQRQLKLKKLEND
jgi:hypothetical protein